MRSSVPLRAAVACALLSLFSQRARAEPIALPKEIHVSVERCVGLVFDVEAYAQALQVELVALGIREPLAPAGQPADPWQDVSGAPSDGAQSQSPRYVELLVTAPGCRDELSVTLRLQRPGESRQSVETLRPSDFEGLGRERALALATVERLRVSWARLLDSPIALALTPGAVPSMSDSGANAPGSPGPPTVPSPGDPAQATPKDATPAAPDAKAEAEKPEAEKPEAEKTAAEKKKDPKPEAPAQPEDDELVADVVPTSGGFIGGGIGYLGALGWQLRGGVFFDRGGRLRVDPQIDVHASRDYPGGTAQAGTSSDAYRVMLGAIVQAQLYANPDFELSLGPGLRFGIAWVDYNVPDPTTQILVPNGDGVLVPVTEFVDATGTPVESASSAEPSTPVAPLVLTTLTLSVRATIAEPVAVLLWIEGGYAVLGAQFYAGSQRVASLSGASFSLGFAAAYLF